MPLVFREIGKLTSWIVDPDENEWSPTDDVKADALKWLKTDGCALSVYFVETGDLALRVAAAFASNRDSVQPVAYALFDYALLESQGFAVNRENGTLPDAEVASWHADVVQLSGTKLAAFARLICLNAEMKLLPSSVIGPQINELRKQGLIQDARLKPKLVAELAKYPFPT